MTASIDRTNWDELIDLALNELERCPHCGAGSYDATPGGQTWMGQGYTTPQYFNMTHWCKKPEDDPFAAMVITLRCRSLDDMIARWNATPSQGRTRHDPD